MTERDQVVEILRKAISPPFKAVMGRGDGVVVVDGRPGYVWCRKLGKTEMLMEAYNRGAPDIEDVIVLVQESRIEGVKGYEVIGVASSTSPGNYYPEVPPHAWTHEWRPGIGRDRVTIYPRAWGYLRAEPIATGSMNVWVTPGWYYYDDYLRWYIGGYSPAFYPPPSGTWYQLLSFEPSDESLHITNGGIGGYGLPLREIPSPSGCTYPIAAIESTGTFGSITENMIEDVRLFMDPIEDCDGNGGVGAHNILDNFIHLDSALDAVTRGSLIVGNDEPEWDELDVGVTGTVLTTDGVDVFWAAPGGVAAHNILDGNVHLDSAADAVTRGSIIVGNPTPDWDELVIGSSGTVLASDGLDPFWAAMPSGGAPTGVSYCNIQWHVDGPLQTGTEIGEARLAPPGFDMLGAWMYCKNPGSAGNTTVDINKNDITIFTAQANRPILPWNDPDNKIKGGALGVTTLTEGDKLSMDIDGVATGVEDLDVLLILGATGTGPAGLGLIEIQEDDVKVTDVSIVNFEGGGGKVADDGGGKVTVDITGGGGPWVLIEDVELGAPAATIDFQNIPATYKHLAILYSLRSDRAGAGIDPLRFRFNNSAVGYDWVRYTIRHPNTLATAEGLNSTFIEFGANLSGATSPANDFASGNIWVRDYADTSKLPDAELHGGLLRDRVAGQIYTTHNYGQWRTAAAVNRITLYPANGPNFIAGSRASLYGIN